MNIMVDLETLDTAPTALVLSVGLVAFDDKAVLDKLYLTIDIQDQINLGRTISADTLKWWMKQSPEARRVFSESGSNLMDSVDFIARFFENYPKSLLWSNGANFDAVILDDMFRMVGVPVPWKYWDVRCFRTFCDGIGRKLSVRRGTHHNALDDAESQALHMIACASKLS